MPALCLDPLEPRQKEGFLFVDEVVGELAVPSPHTFLSKPHKSIHTTQYS